MRHGHPASAPCGSLLFRKLSPHPGNFASQAEKDFPNCLFPAGVWNHRGSLSGILQREHPEAASKCQRPTSNSAPCWNNLGCPTPLGQLPREVSARKQKASSVRASSARSDLFLAHHRAEIFPGVRAAKEAECNCLRGPGRRQCVQLSAPDCFLSPRAGEILYLLALQSVPAGGRAL